MQSSIPQLYLKKKLEHRRFPKNFAEFSRRPFSIEHLRFLLLKYGIWHIERCFILKTALWKLNYQIARTLMKVVAYLQEVFCSSKNFLRFQKKITTWALIFEIATFLCIKRSAAETSWNIEIYLGLFQVSEAVVHRCF